MGLVPFTPSKEFDVACLEDVQFDPKMKSIVWRIEKTLKMGDRPSVTIITKREFVKNVEDNPKQMASMGIASAYAMLTISTNSHRPLRSSGEKWPR